MAPPLTPPPPSPWAARLGAFVYWGGCVVGAIWAGFLIMFTLTQEREPDPIMILAGVIGGVGVFLFGRYLRKFLARQAKARWL